MQTSSIQSLITSRSAHNRFSVILLFLHRIHERQPKNCRLTRPKHENKLTNVQQQRQRSVAKHYSFARDFCLAQFFVYCCFSTQHSQLFFCLLFFFHWARRQENNHKKDFYYFSVLSSMKLLTFSSLIIFAEYCCALRRRRNGLWNEKEMNNAMELLADASDCNAVKERNCYEITSWVWDILRVLRSLRGVLLQFKWRRSDWRENWLIDSLRGHLKMMWWFLCFIVFRLKQ